MLYRAFARRDGSAVHEPGGALFVPRWSQGAGRHDNPYEYGTLYTSRDAESAVAEYLQFFRGQRVSGADLRFADGRVLCLAEIDDADLPALPDLDDPEELAGRELRPSRVATGDRDTTQALAMDLHSGGVPGFSWWSTIEAAWVNVTLFAERALDALRSPGPPERLTTGHPSVRAAAERLGILLD